MKWATLRRMNSPDTAHLIQGLIPSDEDLMLRYCDGDFGAFKELYQRHSKPLYRFIAWRSPRTEWVDEIMQDSWTALHNARAQYQVSASFKTYLYQIARNRLIDLMRQHQIVLASDFTENDDSAFEDYTEIASTNPAGDQSKGIVSTNHNPEQQLIDKQRLHALHDAIDQLPSVQKEALVLQQFNELSLDEIAQISAVPVETIKSRLRYAMQKLRQHFAKPEHRLEEFT